jgi:hypothetical protein
VAEQVLLSVRRGWAHARCRPKAHDAPEAVGGTTRMPSAVLVVKSGACARWHPSIPDAHINKTSPKGLTEPISVTHPVPASNLAVVARPTGCLPLLLLPLPPPPPCTCSDNQRLWDKGQCLGAQSRHVVNTQKGV